MIDKYRCSDILSEISFNCIHLVFKKFTSIALCCTVDIRVSSYHVFIGFLTTQAFPCVTTQNLPRMLYLMLQDQLFSDNIIISCKMSWSATTVKTAIIVSFHTRLLSWSLIFHIFSRVLLESNQREPASHPYYRLVIKDVFHFQKSSAVFIKTVLFFGWLYRQCFTNESQTKFSEMKVNDADRNAFSCKNEASAWRGILLCCFHSYVKIYSALFRDLKDIFVFSPSLWHFLTE